MSVLPSVCFWDFFEDTFRSKGSYSSSYSPPMKAVEKDDGYLLCAELPGFKIEDLEISCEDSKLTVKAEKKEEEKKEGTIVFDEMKSKSFIRSFLVKDINVDEISASLKDGILKINLPRSEESKCRKIKIS